MSYYGPRKAPNWLFKAIASAAIGAFIAALVFVERRSGSALTFFFISYFGGVAGIAIAALAEHETERSLSLVEAVGGALLPTLAMPYAWGAGGMLALMLK